MSSIDVAVDEYTIQVSIDNPVIIVQTSGPPGPPGTGGGGGLDQATADTLYVQLAGETDQSVAGSLNIGNGISAVNNVYAGGKITSETDLEADRLLIRNGDHLQSGIQIMKTDPALSTADPDTLAVYYGPGTTDNERASWANEKGQWRTSNIPAPAEVALKVIGSDLAQGDLAHFLKQNGTIFVRIGPNGTLVAETAFRLVAGAAVGRVLVGDASGNATWQVVPVSTGASPPASPYVGQLWSDPA